MTKRGQNHDGRPFSTFESRVSNSYRDLDDDEIYNSSISEEMRQLICNLHIHKTELLSQNDELQRIQEDLEISRDKYVELYDSAPVGYLTLDNAGTIVEANLTAASLLGTNRSELIGDTFSRYLGQDDSDNLYLQRRSILANKGPQRCEVRILKPDGRHFYAQLDTTGVYGESEATNRFRTTICDITDRKRSEIAFETSRFLQNVIDCIPDSLFVINQSYEIVVMNHAAQKEYQYSINTDKSFFCYNLIYKKDSPCKGRNNPCLLDKIHRTDTPAIVIKRQKENGRVARVIEVRASPLKKKDGTFAGIIVINRDISERVEAERVLRDNELRLQHMATHDPLTELPNRLLFRNHLEAALRLAKQNGSMLALLFIDLDRFKYINDNLGHETGDQVLHIIAKRIQNSVRSETVVARFGGDEFVLLVEYQQNYQQVARIAERILSTTIDNIRMKNLDLSVSASIGISLFPNDGEEPSLLMQYADMAMYRAKENGRNNYQFFTPDMSIRANKQMMILSDLRRALDAEEFVLYYQPQFDIYNRHMVGIETLVRWRHPEKGLLFPKDFIPLAEESGLIVPIGERVLQTACRQNKKWQDAGYPPLKIAVNLSAHQFYQADLIKTLRKVQKESSLDYCYLELEITEGIFMYELEVILDTLNTLKQMGVCLALDDFGTGYSSLNYLKRLPIQKLKIAQEFIKDITINTDDAEIVQSIILLANNMNLQVIAEGVETDAQLEILKNQGCKWAQGYFFSPPLIAEDFTRLLR